MNARYYDPVIGQFISPDTLVPDATNLLDYNRYGYARGNPMKFNDPSGHYVELTCPAFWCNATLVDYSGLPGWAKPGVTGAARMACALMGCDVDSAQGRIVGPNAQEYAQQVTDSLMGAGLTPLATVSIPGVSSRLNGIAERIIGNRTVSDTTLDVIGRILVQRNAYEVEVQALSGQAAKHLASGWSEEATARWAHGLRNELKLKYREGMPQSILDIIEQRNMALYENALGPPIEYLQEIGKTWDQIIAGAARPDGTDVIEQAIEYYVSGGH